MTDLRQAAQQALEAHRMLRNWIKAVPQEVVLPAMPGIDGDWLDEVERNLCSVLAQPEQEPVDGTREGFERWAKSLPNYIDLSRFEDGYSDCNTDYAWAGWQAAQRPWQGLTDEAIWQIATDCTIGGDLHADKFARAIERAHNIKERNA